MDVRLVSLLRHQTHIHDAPAGQCGNSTETSRQPAGSCRSRACCTRPALPRRFDQAYTQARLAELGIPLKREAGKPSGRPGSRPGAGKPSGGREAVWGQQAQVARTLAPARRPHLLVLDEPVAILDPIARHDFMAAVLAAASADGVSVLLPSHVLALSVLLIAATVWLVRRRAT